MDGVLVDSGAHHRAAWRALLEELGVTPPEHEHWRLTIGRPGVEAVSRLLGRELPWPEARRLARRKHEYYAKLAGQGLPAIPGAPAFVGRLADHAVPMGVATSATRREAERLLRDLRLRHHFGAMVTAEDVQLGKPDPEVYLRAARELGLEPGQCLVFEDSVVGIEAARRAGMRVIALTTSYPQEELAAAGAARVIRDFEGCPWPL